MTTPFCCQAKRGAHTIRMHRGRNLRGGIRRASEAILVRASNGRIAAGATAVDGMTGGTVEGGSIVVEAAGMAMDTGIIADTMADTPRNGGHN